MGVSTEFTKTEFEFEDIGDVTFQFNSNQTFDYTPCSSPDSDFEFTFPTVTSTKVCYGCNSEIEDQFVLRVNDQSWHPSCLRCSYCHNLLNNHTTCYFRGGKIYCKKEEYGLQCGKCDGHIRNNDWVRQAHGNQYHLACFSCDVCHRQLPTGEQFAFHNNRLLCKHHYLQEVHGGKVKCNDRSAKRRAKRMRTAFTEEQVKIFQFYYNLEQNPDSEDLDTIAEQAGVVRRVAQVWFQNARARTKKNSQSSALSPVSISSKDSSSSEYSFEGFEDLITFDKTDSDHIASF